MNSYVDYIREISADDVLEGFLGYGLFADQLPDIFTSQPFYDYCIDRKDFGFAKAPCDYIRYESMRNVNVPRAISIPNPFAYALLCKHISEYWNKIVSVLDDKTKNQKHIISQIHIQKLKDKKSLFQMCLNYENKDRENLESIQKIHVTKRVRVDADISNCFPSIYSNSLCWALVGKTEAKEHKSDSNLWYNKMDMFCRNVKNGETNGLLIGPHASNLLSELVLCSVDAELLGKYIYVRNIDDFTCYVDSDKEAESFLLDLNAALKQYELNINTKKTQIRKLPITSDTDWVAALNSFFIGCDKTEDERIVFEYQRLKSYLDFAIQLSNKTGNNSVFVYVIKVIAGCHLGQKALRYYLDILHHLVCLYPYLVHWMEEFVFSRFDVSKDEIRTIANNVYSMGKERRVYEACSFSLYWSLKHKISIIAYYVDDAIISGDCIFLTVSWMLAKRNKDKEQQKKLKAHAQSLLGDLNKYWLFVYEALSKEQLPDNDFKAIKNKGISFLRNDI